eukprot:g377.t2
MSLRFAFLVAFVLFVATPSLESIGARAIRVATRVECYKACSAARTGNEAVLLGFNNAGVYLCHCVCPGLNGGGPLHAAVKSGCGHCFHLLTIGGGKCRCDDRDYFGNTPLHLAASLCFDPMTNRAITAKCNVDLKNYFGFTPLCLVSRRTSGSECGRVVRSILGNGSASPCIRCSGGKACDICGFPGTCDILEQDKACTCH